MSSKRAATNNAIEIGGTKVKPGQHVTVELPLAAMYTHADVMLTVHVVNGRRPGPCIFVCAAIHGDELNGVEIIRRLLKSKQLDQLHGTLLAIPLVDRKSTRLNSSHVAISYAVFCLKKK